ncbi:MAG: tetratricopeptide repeat-containing protein [Candidatus Wallbacteria bacterium]|nr:tetratricopeptide repeat-containing protein [Candidatus Wallbacteria bacterium]
MAGNSARALGLLLLVAVLHVLRVPTFAELFTVHVKLAMSKFPASERTVASEAPADDQSSESQAEIQKIYALADAGKHDEALQLARQLLDRSKRNAGANHPDVAEATYCLGQVLLSKGDLAGAREQLEDALVLRERHYGKNHLAVAQAEEALGDLSFQQGDFSAAKPHYERTVAVLAATALKDGPRMGRLQARLSKIRSGGLEAAPKPAGKPAVPITTAKPPPEPVAIAGPPGSAGELWAIVPTPEPAETALDGYQWRWTRDFLALSLSLLGQKACLDPWDSDALVGPKGVDPKLLQPPTAVGLRRFGAAAGAKHLLVPMVSGSETTGFRFQLKHCPDSTGGSEAVELAGASLDAKDPQAAAEAVVGACKQGLEKLGISFKPGAANKASLLGPPAPPAALLKEIQAQGKSIRARARDPLALACFSEPLSILGYYLAHGNLPMGPRLLIRGSAVAALALALTPRDPQAQMARALGHLLARHAEAAHRALAPALAAGDADARALEAACTGDWQALAADTRHRLLFIVALERSSKARLIANRIPPFYKEQVPMAYWTLGIARQLGVGGGRQVSSMFLAAGEEDSVPANSRKIDIRRTASWAVPMLQQRAAKLPPPPPDPSARGDLEPGLTPARARAVRCELLGLPAVEYAVVAATLWGVPEEAKAVLEAARDALPESQAVPNMMAALAAADRTGRLQSWKVQASSEDPADPWASTASFESGMRQARGRAARLAWDLGSPCFGLVRESLGVMAQSPALAQHSALSLEFELSVDPWDVGLWALRLANAAARLPWPELKAEIERARKALPKADVLATTEAAILMDRGAIASAARILNEAATSFPDPDSAIFTLLNLYMSGDRLGKARQAAEMMRLHKSDSLAQVAALCRIADRMLDLGKVEDARPLVDQARAMEQWKGDALLLTGRFLIHDGKVDEGLGWYEKYAQRYPSGSPEGWRPIKVLLEAGRKDLAGNLADKSPPEALADAGYLMELANAFNSYGDSTRGMDYRRRGRDAITRQLGAMGKGLANAVAAPTDLKISRDGRLLKEWLGRAENQNLGSVLEAIRANPFPEAVEAMLDGVKMERVGRQCAQDLAQRAGVDIDLPQLPLAEDLARAHQTLSAWWSKAAPRYLESRLE